MMNPSGEQYELTLPDGDVLTIEGICRDGWEGMNEPCPNCGSTEFEHIEFEGGAYGQSEDAVILRTDYWNQKGSLYTECRECGFVLYKHPAYDVIQHLNKD